MSDISAETSSARFNVTKPRSRRVAVMATRIGAPLLVAGMFIGGLWFENRLDKANWDNANSSLVGRTELSRQIGAKCLERLEDNPSLSMDTPQAINKGLVAHPRTCTEPIPADSVLKEAAHHYDDLYSAETAGSVFELVEGVTLAEGIALAAGIAYESITYRPVTRVR
jgi:hypothetical protein